MTIIMQKKGVEAAKAIAQKHSKQTGGILYVIYCPETQNYSVESDLWLFRHSESIAAKYNHGKLIENEN